MMIKAANILSLFLLSLAAASATCCSDYQVLDGTCAKACTCPCANGLGVLVRTTADDCDEPTDICMDPLLADEAVIKGDGNCIKTCPVDDKDCDVESGRTKYGGSHSNSGLSKDSSNSSAGKSESSSGSKPASHG